MRKCLTKQCLIHCEAEVFQVAKLSEKLTLEIEGLRTLAGDPFGHGQTSEV